MNHRDTLPEIAPDAAFSSATGYASTIDVAGTAVTPAPRYQIGPTLGRGGMGRVVRAHDRFLARDVALKELDYTTDIATRVRFLREVQLAAQLQHPNIIPIYDLPAGAHELRYTMRLVEGQSLADALAAAKDYRGRIALLDRFRDVCNAMAFAHSRRIIHRDIKPDNVMLGEHGDSLLVDWGLAKKLDDDDKQRATEITEEGAFIGTPRYLAPEQLEGHRGSTRTDVWSLGVVLYELLVGHVPFTATKLEALYEDITSAPIVRPRTLCRDVSPELETICLKALSRDPAERYADAGELVRDLDAAIAGRLVGAHVYTLGELAGRFVRQNRAAVTVGVVAVLAVAALIAKPVDELPRSGAQGVQPRTGQLDLRLGGPEQERPLAGAL